MTVVPDPSAWALGSGYEATFDLEDLNEQIDREYQTMLDGALEHRARRPTGHQGPARGPAGPSIVAEARANDHDD